MNGILLRAVGELPNAAEVPDRLRAAFDGRVPAVFLDFDGTLTPIVERPEMAVLSAHGREVVSRLAERLPVAIVSGRDRSDVETLVGLKDVVYAGGHGLDIVVPGQGHVDSALSTVDGLIDRTEAALREALAPFDGALIERKRFSVASHYRHVAPGQVPAFSHAVDAAQQAVGRLKRKEGKKVIELLPDIDWDKGRAVLHLMEVLGLSDASHVPVFFGDDVTDEDAFTALHDRGVGIVVAPADGEAGRRTAAHFRLDDPEAVLAMLDRLEP